MVSYSSIRRETFEPTRRSARPVILQTATQPELQSREVFPTLVGIKYKHPDKWVRAIKRRAAVIADTIVMPLQFIATL